MYRQRGITLSGFVLWAIVLVTFALLGLRIGPPYLEYLAIQKQLKAIANDPEARSGLRRDVENVFSRRAAIENIKSISAKDLQISKQGDQLVVSVDYSVCVPVVANIRACMDYSASSAR
jgi:hypothetical protein